MSDDRTLRMLDIQIAHWSGSLPAKVLETLRELTHEHNDFVAMAVESRPAFVGELQIFDQDGYDIDDIGDDSTPRFEGGYWTDPNDPTA